MFCAVREWGAGSGQEDATGASKGVESVEDKEDGGCAGRSGEGSGKRNAD